MPAKAGHPARPTRCVWLWILAFEAVSLLRDLALSFSYPSFPRKRAKAGTQGFQSLAPGSPLSRGRRIGPSAGFPDSPSRGGDGGKVIGVVCLVRRLGLL